MAKKDETKKIGILTAKLQRKKVAEINKEVAMLIFRVRGLIPALAFVDDLNNPAHTLPIEREAQKVATRQAA